MGRPGYFFMRRRVNWIVFGNRHRRRRGTRRTSPSSQSTGTKVILFALFLGLLAMCSFHTTDVPVRSVHPVMMAALTPAELEKKSALAQMTIHFYSGKTYGSTYAVIKNLGRKDVKNLQVECPELMSTSLFNDHKKERHAVNRMVKAESQIQVPTTKWLDNLLGCQIVDLSIADPPR